MAEHVFESPRVEEFYNSCHTKQDGRFCGVKAKGKGVQRVPMSDAARRSNAILRATASARKSPEYKQAKKAIGGSWARREHGQGGNVGSGRNSAKADRARAANAQGKNPANKDGSDKLVGGFKLTGHKSQDAIAISRLDRGSSARKAAARKFEEAYGKAGSGRDKQTSGVKQTVEIGNRYKLEQINAKNQKELKTGSKFTAGASKPKAAKPAADHVGGTAKATPAARRQFAKVYAAWQANPTKATKDRVRDYLNKYDDL